MLLLIDAGNTRIKWALTESPAEASPARLGNWSAGGSVEHDRLGTLAADLQSHDISRVIVSNVAGAAVSQAIERALVPVLGLKPAPLEWFVSVPALAGIRNGYRNSAQLGVDRFASAIGAHALFPKQELVIATCGTATTIDAVSADGCFIGGMILPGLELMAGALARHTAQLPRVPGETGSGRAFADNTEAAIASGCITAQAGAIERAVACRSKALGHAETVQCIVSGGAAYLIAPHLQLPYHPLENLVLIGLQVVAAHSH